MDDKKSLQNSFFRQDEDGGSAFHKRLEHAARPSVGRPMQWLAHESSETAWKAYALLPSGAAMRRTAARGVEDYRRSRLLERGSRWQEPGVLPPGVPDPLLSATRLNNAGRQRVPSAIVVAAEVLSFERGAIAF